jgi:hypothetical protein
VESPVLSNGHAGFDGCPRKRASRKAGTALWADPTEPKVEAQRRHAIRGQFAGLPSQRPPVLALQTCDQPGHVLPRPGPQLRVVVLEQWPTLDTSTCRTGGSGAAHATRARMTIASPASSHSSSTLESGTAIAPRSWQQRPAVGTRQEHVRDAAPYGRCRSSHSHGHQPRTRRPPQPPSNGGGA